MKDPTYKMTLKEAMDFQRRITRQRRWKRIQEEYVRKKLKRGKLQ